MVFTRSVATSMLGLCITALLSAATGTINFRVRDSRSHRAVQAVIKSEGPEPFTVTTDDRGRTKRQTPVGEYRLEISAFGYKTLRTYVVVESGKTANTGVYLDSKTVPDEESTATLNPLLRPGYTLLHEYVTDAETGEPISGVKVRLVNAGVEAQTDLNGHYLLSFPTPQVKIPGGLGTDTLIYKKPGYKTIVLRNFSISSEEIGGTAVDLEKGKGVIDIDGTHKLIKQEPEPQAAGPA